MREHDDLEISIPKFIFLVLMVGIGWIVYLMLRVVHWVQMKVLRVFGKAT